MFKVGDKVRLKLDAKDDLPLVIRAIKDENLFLCVSSCGNRRTWCCEFDLELVETQTDIKQAIREVLLSEEFLAAFAKAWMKTPILHESELNLAGSNSVVKENLKTEKWKPKIGDWVKIHKPSGDRKDFVLWSNFMDEHDGEIVCVSKVGVKAIRYKGWDFHFDWLEPAEAPINSDAIPEGYRKLNDSSEEPRQMGDLRWSVGEKRYVEISSEEISYANRDNWAACRKVAQEVKPPDGWRWIENGEVLRRGDRRYKDFVFWDLEARYVGVNASDAFDTKFIRRNRFNVGEKVVYTIDGSIWTYKSEIDDGPRFPKSAWVTRHGGVSQRTCVNHLAPHIEDAK